MILVTLKIAVPARRHAQVAELFATLAGPVRVEPGCLWCELYQDAGTGDDFLYVEEWETPEQLERHLRSARYERLLAMMEASDRPPVLRYCWVSGVRGLEYLEAVRLGGAATPPRPAEPL
jgi:quinol monooxygenase YgiN